MERVVVGDDGSRRSRPAVDFAIDEAQRWNLPLTLLRVCEPSTDPALRLPAQRRAHDRIAEEAGRQLRATLDQVVSRSPGVPVDGLLLTDPSEDELARRLAGCALLVVGARGHRGRRAFSLGSTSGKLLHATNSPVVVVPGESVPGAQEFAVTSPRQPTHVLVGVDDGPHGPLLLRAAAAEARRRGTSLHVLHAYGPLSGDSNEHALSVGWQVLNHQLRLAALGGGLHVSKMLSAEPAASALRRQASSAELLVIGPRGPLAMAGLALDSVSCAVLDAPPCPVLLVSRPSDSPDPSHSRSPHALGSPLRTFS